jgi:hypothetical protein
MRLTDTRRPQRRLKVLITIDTEVWPHRNSWREENLEGDLQRDVYGATRKGEYGIVYQCEMLRAHGLTGVFFVETAFASVVGLEPLTRIVKTLRKYDQGVELHVHPEWGDKLPTPVIPTDRNVKFFHELAFEHQRALLDLACNNLRAAGMENIRAFRAGNYGANFETLKALRSVGVFQDFSYNAALLGRLCKLDTPQLLCGPTEFDGVVEFPTAHFEDYPGHVRPAQLVACSSAEMEHALNEAWNKEWSHFIILSHSFELIHRHTDAPKVNPTVVRRMERLCRYLEREKDRFETVACDSLENTTGTGAPTPAIGGLLLNTVGRYVEQAWKRIH